MLTLFEATVERETGKSRNWVGQIINDAVVPASLMPRPASIAIAQDETGFFLLYYDAQKNCMTDSWHESLEDAMEQAKFEFDINESDWVRCEENKGVIQLQQKKKGSETMK